MICVDIGLPELAPLPVMGAGMTHVARIVLAAAIGDRAGWCLWMRSRMDCTTPCFRTCGSMIAKAAEQFNVQVFATTHSFECIEAAHEALGSDGFRLHRLEVVDGA